MYNQKIFSETGAMAPVSVFFCRYSHNICRSVNSSQGIDVIKFVINKVKIVLMNRLDRKLCALFAAVLVLLPAAVSCKKDKQPEQPGGVQ